MSTSQQGGPDYPQPKGREYPPPDALDDRESDSPQPDDAAMTEGNDDPATGGHLSGSGYTGDTYSNPSADYPTGSSPYPAGISPYPSASSAYPSESAAPTSPMGGVGAGSQGLGYQDSAGYGTTPRYGTQPGLESPGYGTAVGARSTGYQAGTGHQSPAYLSGRQDQSTTDVAKQQAGEVAGHAADAAKDLAQTAQQQVGDVADEARWQARHLLHQAQSEVADQAATQQQRIAGGLHQVADQLHSMAARSDEQGMVTDLARQAADRTHQLAGWLDDRDPNGVLNEVRSFARRRPGMFLAVALGAGLLAGRLARNMAADPDELARQQRQGGARSDGRSPTRGYQPGIQNTGGYNYGAPSYEYGQPITTPAMGSGALPPAAAGAAPLAAPPYGMPVTGGPVTDTGAAR